MRTRCDARAGAVLLAAAAVMALSGCYNFRAPYNKSVRTVYVPVFKSQSFRRDVNLQMTDLVIKEIEKRTPYKVVGSPEGADMILEGNISFADKNLIVESPFNLPRQLTAMVNATVNWTHNPPTPEEAKRGPVIIGEMMNFVPEIGETSLTAFYATCQRLATQVVDMMEQPWEGGDTSAVLVPAPGVVAPPR